MRKRYWRDALWFVAGMFLGSFVLGTIGSLFGAVRGG